MADGLGGLQPKSADIRLQKSGVDVGIGDQQLTPQFLNLVAGTNVSLTTSEDLTDFDKRKYTVVISSTGGGGSGGGLTRSINSISDDTTAGATAGTDYFYIATGSLVITLPDAASNTNFYSIKNSASAGSVVIAGSGTQTIDGSSTAPILIQNVAIDLISDGTNWSII